MEKSIEKSAIIRTTVSTINGKIFCGYVKDVKGVKMWSGKKHDITADVVESVAHHLIITDSYMEYEIDGQKYELRMIKI